MGDKQSRPIPSQRPPEYQSVVQPNEHLNANMAPPTKAPERPPRPSKLYNTSQPTIPPPIQNEPVESAESSPVESPESTEKDMGPPTICNVDIRQWFLIHSIVLSILNAPVIIVTTPMFGLSIYPFTYTLILLAAAIWRKIPALQTINVLVYVNLVACLLLLVIVPTVAVSQRFMGYTYSVVSDRVVKHFRVGDYPQFLEVVGTGLLFSIPVFILIIKRTSEIYAGESSAPPPPYSAVHPSAYDAPKSPGITSDTQPILPVHNREPVVTNTHVAVGNGFLHSVRNTPFGTWFTLHSVVVSLLVLPLIVYCNVTFIQIALLCYIFTILFAAFGQKITVLHSVIGIAVVEVICGFGLMFVVLDSSLARSIGFTGDVTAGQKFIMALFVLFFIFLSGSQLYLAHKVLQIAKSQLNGVFVSVSTRVSR